MPKTIQASMLATACCLTLGASATVAQAQGRADTKPKVVTSAPSLNFYGVPGIVDLPSGEALPDGQLAIGVSNFGGQTRTNLTFQFSPRISATFRYIGIQDWNSDGFDTYRDRSFDVRYLLFKEGRYRPSVTVGLQDFAGTGIYAAEYIAATKNFKRPFRLPGKLKVTAGLGWGRLGTLGDIGSLSGGTRPVFNPNDTGGEPATDQWFRGPVSPFAGIEWQVNDRLGLKAEYSTDAYQPETSRGVFDRDSRLNFGAEYQVNNNLRVGGYWLYGSEIGINAQLQFNPKTAPAPYTIAGPRPIIVRPSRRANPAAYDTAWASAQSAPMVIRDAVEPELTENGIRLETLSVTGTRAEARVSSIRYDNHAIVVGRTARTLARILPPSVETFDITLMNNGLALSTVTISRSDFESLEFQPDAADLLLSKAVISDAAPRPAPNAVVVDNIHPRFGWSIGPYFRPSYFDPDEPLRYDAGIAAEARYRFAPGWLVAGEVRHRVTGTIGDSTRLSNSVLPRVRTDAVLFAQGADTTIENLYVSKQWKPGKSTYARVTAGYLEQMFGGVSAELLWKPTGNRLALGVEANYARQRDFDQAFGFQDYSIATGHVSAYYEFGRGYYGQVDVGRYLAGDYGATFTVEREFNNGWRVGGFFTLTDVSAEDFGEGSFDKGINITIPVSWFIGRPTRQSVSTTIRPIQRDGGARLNVPGRLYQQVRDGHINDLTGDWGRVWE
ncbi:YjbH domain-containing protein [uncultured Tateyamaria sp.]|uniref:YjbH domain-containing protein n=1 Tax=uncultured Tateyamaria sp. TaxID=455651 RepID=UPI002602291B|nr:YjbH domain-containing protein [uncultured Tateyamaria sp.]